MESQKSIDRRKLQDKIKSLELSISSTTTSSEYKDQMKELLQKAQAEYKAIDTKENIGSFYIDIPQKYESIRHVLYSEKKEGNIKSYSIKADGDMLRLFFDKKADMDLIFGIYNERREKAGDEPVIKEEVTGTTPKMRHGKFIPVKKKIDSKSVKSKLMDETRLVKNQL